MALYRGYAETRVGGGPVRRFLLDTDIGPLFNQPATVVNHLDLDQAGTPKRPDLQVRLIVRAIDTERTTTDGSPFFVDTHLEIVLEPEPDRVLQQVEVSVFLDMSDNVYTAPVAGQPPPLPTPDPSQFVFVRYRGDAGQRMPDKLTLHLSSRKYRRGAAAADPIVDDSIDIVVNSTPVAGPLHLAGGQLEGTVTPRAAVSTTFTGTPAVYTEAAPVDARTINLTAPNATIANLSVSTPGMPTFPLDCLWVGIGTDHTSGSPNPPPPTAAAPPGTPAPPGLPTAPVVALAGAGAGNVSAGTHRYKVAYLLRNGRETKPSDPSAPVTVANPGADGRVRVTGLPIGLSAVGTRDPDVEVVARRVYRTLASETADDGEYRRVVEVPNNTAVEVIDDVADSALGEPPADRMTVHVSSYLRHDVSGDLTLRSKVGTAVVEDVFEVDLGELPTDARVFYNMRPGAGRPRVRWQADAVLGSARLKLPKLNSGAFRWGEARLDSVPQFLGATWSVLAGGIFAVEIGGPTVGDSLAARLGRAELLLSSVQLPWRDARQAVCVEQVSRQWSDGSTRSARTRIGIRDLLRARVALGEAGPRHAKKGDGVTVQLQLGRDLISTHMPEWVPPHALRFLLIDERFRPTASSSHLSVRAGDVSDSLDLDLRMSDATPGPEYFGVHVVGALLRLKILSLTNPSPGRESYAADGARLWLTVPITPEEFDITRSDGDTLVVLPRRTFAEASVRLPDGFDASEDPLRHAKVALSAPGSARAGPGVIAYGTAGAGTTANTLVDPSVPFDASHGNASVRYLTGANVGLRRAATAVDPTVVDAAGVVTTAGSLTTAAFPTTPAVGDRYALEDRDGFAVETSILGPGVDARVALSKELDRFVPTRATPQVKLRTAALPGAPEGVVPEPQLRSLTARVYGVRAASLGSEAVAGPPAGDVLSVPVLLDNNRVNKSLRAYIRTQEDPVGTTERDLMKARIATVPPEVRVDVDTSMQKFGVTLSEASGPGAFWMEPPLVRGSDAGPRMDTRAGIGLVQFEFDMIPRAVRATILGPGAFPMNFTPPAGFTGGGITAEVSEMAAINFFRMIRWGRDNRDDLNEIYWSRMDANFIRWNQDTPAVAPAPAMMTPVSFWLFGESDPADEKKAGAGMGFAIPTPGVTLTLDVDVYSKTVNLANAQWDALPGQWNLQQELQMSGYAGTVTISSTATASFGLAAGNPGIGPGRWFLRLVDGRSWDPPLLSAGSAYFGNTGGWLGSRPRIFQ